MYERILRGLASLLLCGILTVAAVNVADVSAEDQQSVGTSEKQVDDKPKPSKTPIEQDETEPKKKLEVSFELGKTAVLEPLETEMETTVDFYNPNSASTKPLHVRVMSPEIGGGQPSDGANLEFTSGAEFDLPPQTKHPIKVKITGLVRDGPYTVKVSADVPKNTTLSSTAEIMITRRDVALAADVTGAVDAQGTLIFRPETSDHQEFQLTVTEPKDSGRVRCLRLPDRTLFGENTLKVMFAFERPAEQPAAICGENEAAVPKQAPFAPGQSRLVTATIGSGMTAATYSGSIRLEDAADPSNVFKTIPLKVEPTFGTWQPTWSLLYAFLAVLLGALVSVFLNQAAPLTLKKRQFRKRLRSIGDRIDKLTVNRLKLRLANERHGWPAQVEALNLGSPEDEVTALGTAIDTVEQKLAIAEEIGVRREQLRRKPELPLVLVARADAHLRNGIWQLINGNKDDAEKELKDAKAIELSQQNLAEIQTLMAQRFETIATIAPKAPSVIEPKSMQAAFDAFKAALPKLKSNELSKREVLELDPRLFRLELLVRRFDNGIMVKNSLHATLCADADGPSYDDCVANLRDRLVTLLERRGVDSLEAAEKLLRDMETGFLPGAIVERIENSKGTIDASDSEPKAGELITFTLTLGNPYDDSTAARELVYRWDLGDGSTPALGKRCSHVFDQEGYYTVTVEAKEPAGGWVKLNKDAPPINVKPALGGRGPATVREIGWSMQNGDFFGDHIFGVNAGLGAALWRVRDHSVQGPVRALPDRYRCRPVPGQDHQ